MGPEELCWEVNGITYREEITASKLICGYCKEKWSGKIVAWRFRASKKLVGGLRVNYSATGGLGLSVGVKGARVGINQKEVRTTLSIPGTGIINVERHAHSKNGKAAGLKLGSKSKPSDTDYAINKLNYLSGGLFEFVSCSGTDAWEYNGELNKIGKVSIGPAIIQFEWELDKNKRTDRTNEVVGGSFSINQVKFIEVNYAKVKGIYSTITIVFEQCAMGKFSMTFKGDDSHIQPLYMRTKQYKSKPCFVATAVYGSFDCSEVLQLRRWRDTFLTRHFLGRAFIKNYYIYGPSLAGYVLIRPLAKRFIRKGLDILLRVIK